MPCHAYGKMWYRLDGKPRALFLCLIGLALGCEGRDSDVRTERLWISGIPTRPKTSFSAFATTKAAADRFVGAFFVGSLLRGRHDAFEWKNDGDDGAVLRFLQDDETLRVRFERCTPTTGFDDCIIMHGDPTGSERYQSRKRWTIKRPGRRHDTGSLLVMEAIAELVEGAPRG